MKLGILTLIAILACENASARCGFVRLSVNDLRRDYLVDVIPQATTDINGNTTSSSNSGNDEIFTIHNIIVDNCSREGQFVEASNAATNYHVRFPIRENKGRLGAFANTRGGTDQLFFDGSSMCVGSNILRLRTPIIYKYACR